MSAKTKIVVLHMKELIYTGIFATLGILLVVLMLVLFLPDKTKTSHPQDEVPSTETNEDTSVAKPYASSENGTSVQTSASAGAYIPGIYTTQLVLNGQTLDVEVIVSQEAVTSIRLVNPSESITTMYPLLAPTLKSISDQIYETQSLGNVTYTADSKYTSLVLLEAIQNSLQKAQPPAVAQ